MPLAPRELQQPRPEEATTAAARDTSAFGKLYLEHFDGLYDFVARIVRDRDLAGEIVQATFTKAWDELRSGHELRNPKAWLYAVARNRSLDELRRNARLADEPFIYAQPDLSRLSDPQSVAEAKETVELVWSSASALSPEEYSLLDLHVRHGLSAADLADALHLQRGAVYTRLSRLRTSLEDAVTSTLLVRHGREECPQLAAIVAEHETGGDITPELRRAVQAHLKDCETCKEARRRFVSPVALFGLMTPVVALPGVRDGIFQTIVPGGTAHAAGASVAGAKAAGIRQGSKARYLAMGAGGAAAAGLVALALSSGSPSLHDPDRVTSVDHTIGVPSADPTVSMQWSPAPHAHGYSVVFSRDRSVEPPARENVTGTRFTSAPLAPGRWWFILRTHGKDGGWTHTLRAGPFVITAAVAEHRPASVAPKKQARHTRSPKVVAASPKPVVAAAPAALHPVVGVRIRTAPRRHAPTTPKTKPPPKKNNPPPAPPASQPPPTATVPAPAEQPVVQVPAAQPPEVERCDDDDQDEDEGEHEEEHKADKQHDDHGDHGDDEGPGKAD